MYLRLRTFLPLLALLALPACGGDDDGLPGADADPSAPDAGPPLDKELVAEGFASPVGLASIPGDPRIFVVEQEGTVRVVKDGNVLPDPFLDVSAQVSCCGERGLLNLVFHPQVAQNRRFFIYTTDGAGDMVISEGTVDAANPDVAAGGVTEVIKIPHPQFGNHNGGWLAFGPDGLLYAGHGDGGSGGDPFDAGQNLMDLRGKIIRIDVDGPLPYEVPSDNPFVNMGGGVRGEIWHYGLRNPWRACFDRMTGDLWIGDVGQNAWEEIDVAPAGMGGMNWGWSDLEGNHCYNEDPCDLAAYDAPLYEYSHEGSGASVTGGCVYRGSAMPWLAGTYFFAEEVDSWMRSLRPDGGGGHKDLTELSQFDGIRVTTFGEDGAGEILFTDYDTGRVYRLIAGQP